MYRKIYQQLLDWKRNSQGHTSLLIEGARRVGKSYIVNEFGRKEYRSFVVIDFNQAGPAIRELFQHYLDNLPEFFLRLPILTGVPLYERESLIVFDEVQMFPRARAALKYLVADGRYDYLETGSLLSIKENVRDIVIPSEEHAIQLAPMDFEEYLWARNEANLGEFLRNCHADQKSLGGALHRKAMDLFREYLIVGGMPQAVETFLSRMDFATCDAQKRDILQLYRNDIRKHSNGLALNVEAIFDAIPSQLQRHERPFKLSALGTDARMRTYQEAFLWLQDARIVNHAFLTTEPSLGLKMNLNQSRLKCYMADTGLLISHAFDEKLLASNEVYRKLLYDRLGVNLGMVMENIVAQTLRANGHGLYFYSSQNSQNKEDRMEIDFLIAKPSLTNRHNICPIEVKSGKNYTVNSLRKFIAKYRQELHTPYLLHDGDFQTKDGITFLPLYFAHLL